MILVDTSVWIEIFRKPARIRIESIGDLDEVALCLPIVQEILQGIKEDRPHRIAREALTSFPLVESPLREEIFLEAAELFRTARRRGLTVRSGVDCLIAVCAIRNELEIVHRDRDFDKLASVSPLRVRAIVS